MRYTRREFIKAGGGFLCAYTLAPHLLEAAQAKKTNILFLITDQHHHHVLGCAGNPLIKTPNIDKLAAQGARFTNAVCATPFCSPTRASFLTGQWPHTHGVVRNIEKNDVGLKNDVIASEQILFDKGYCTRQMGKWHLGNVRDLRCYNNDEEDAVSQQAYQQWLKEQPREKWHKPHEGNVVIGDVELTQEMAKFYDIWSRQKNRSAQNLALIGRSLRPTELTFEFWLADRCIEMIKKYKSENFMITYSISPPHPLWVVPDPYYSMYNLNKMLFPNNFNHHPSTYKDSQAARLGLMMNENLLREYLRCYYGLVTMADDCIGKILDALKAEGLEKNTLVIFTSDHGDMQAGHRMVGKSVHAFYEEIIRVPLIIRYPGNIKPGTVLNTHVGSVDLMPTILDYVGVKIPKGVQGTSLKPLLDGRAKENDRPAFSERGLGDIGSFSRMIRTKEWKYCIFSDGRRELFNLEKDPGEVNDLGTNIAYKDIRQKLDKQIREHMDATKDPALSRL